MELHEIIIRRAVFHMQVLAMCEICGGSITSTLRTVFRNVLVGGHPKSRHLTGDAVDVVLDDVKDVKALMQLVKEGGYYALDEGDHIHIQREKKKSGGVP